MRINGDFIGCVVEPGTHAIVLTFWPSSFTIGCVLSLIGMLGIALGIKMA